MIGDEGFFLMYLLRFLQKKFCFVGNNIDFASHKNNAHAALKPMPPNIKVSFASEKKLWWDESKHDIFLLKIKTYDTYFPLISLLFRFSV